MSYYRCRNKHVGYSMTKCLKCEEPVERYAGPDENGIFFDPPTFTRPARPGYSIAPAGSGHLCGNAP